MRVSVCACPARVIACCSNGEDADLATRQQSRATQPLAVVTRWSRAAVVTWWSRAAHTQAGCHGESFRDCEPLWRGVAGLMDVMGPLVVPGLKGGWGDIAVQFAYLLSRCEEIY